MDEDNETADELRDVLRRNGFVRCDIAACNCGGWHARYGLPERWDEVKDALAEAGHPLCNKNGNLVRYALKDLIEERDRLRALMPNVEFSGPEAALSPEAPLERRVGGAVPPAPTFDEGIGNG